ncbi:MAG: hypothetical protein ACK4M9_01660 [Anaerobacillus sp.]|uniref:hypothetical protein n=1 Tax=Anaerobacillus sp. TaxID=1872506 RepID=UPI00391D39E8
MSKSILKFLFIFGVFFTIGYNFGHLTEGTIFENPLIFLITIFVIIFALQYLVNKFMGKNHGNNSEVDSVLQEFEHTWNIKYKGGEMKIVNNYNEEKLFLNDTLVDHNKRSSWYSWLKPYHILKSDINLNGQYYPLKVKLGGFYSLCCKVYVEGRLVFEDKVKYKYFGDTIKKIEKNVDGSF